MNIMKHDPTKAAAKAHTDLTVFHGVIQLMEGGLLSADSYGDAERIIKICKRASQKCLARYDQNVERAARRHT
jgi:hypothetical protein